MAFYNVLFLLCSVGRRSIAINMYVCLFAFLSVCSLTHLQKPHVQTSLNFLHIGLLPVAVA